MDEWSRRGFTVCGESIRQIENRLRRFVQEPGGQYLLTHDHEPMSEPLFPCLHPVVVHIAHPDARLLAELILIQRDNHEIWVELRTDPALDHSAYVQIIACIDPKRWFGPVLHRLTDGRHISRRTIIDNIPSTLGYFIPWLARRSPSVVGGVPGYDVDMEITSLQGYQTGVTNPISVYQELVLRTRQRGLPEWRGKAIDYTLEEIAPGRIRLEASHEPTDTIATLFRSVIEGILDTWPEARRRAESEKQVMIPQVTAKIILFIGADPSDQSRLRLGEEVREIAEKLQLAKLRDEFKLEQRHATRVVDLTQALLDVKPNIVHFSGHGTLDGTLCLEDSRGLTHPVPPEALGDLFEQFARDVGCVVLNACFSESQAASIARHVNYVIGMSADIGDKAAIAFSVGFYQALGAGRTIADAYKLGCVQIRLQGIPEDLTPILIGPTDGPKA